MKFDEAVERFYKHCIVKNISPFTLEYYKKTMKFFKDNYPVEYLSEIDIDYVEDMIYQERQKNIRKPTSLNTNLRGLRTFLYFCMDREYMQTFRFQLIKTNP